jgi:hypothetical protein
MCIEPNGWTRWNRLGSNLRQVKSQFGFYLGFGAICKIFARKSCADVGAIDYPTVATWSMDI